MGWLTTSIVGKALSSIIVIVTAILTVSIVGASEDFGSRYAIVVDAGSTGTRAFVFHKVGVDNVTDVIRGYPCGKERSGLSSFSTNHSAVEHLFTGLLQTAASIIPAQFHSSTAVYVRGTAGMRLLELPDQDALWDSTVRMLKKSADVPFLIERKNFGTITGHQEAFYAVLASNYIAGSIDGQLRLVPGETLIGALDMGGSSNQLVIYNGSDPTSKVDSGHFWSHSWLRYGAEMIRERILQYLYETHARAQPPSAGGDSTSAPSMDAVFLSNPCGFAGYMDPYAGSYVFNGTGVPQECVGLIERIVWADSTPLKEPEGELKHDTITEDGVADLTMGAVSTGGSVPPRQAFCATGPCPIEQVKHPSVRGHEFYAMSVYFYALDCVRELGPEPIPHWPTPSIAELRVAAEKFCAVPWSDVKERYDVLGGHEWTYPSQLPYRCLEALYIVTLLEKGFGFDPHMRNITLALEVKGQEVEWTLGYALAEVDFQAAPATHAVEVDDVVLWAHEHLSPAEELRLQAEMSRLELLAYLRLANNAIALLERFAKQLVDNVQALRAEYELLVEGARRYRWW